jgi:hypothetical protein
MSMSLRNELRQTFNNATLFQESYNWEDWYSYTRRGADAINEANQDVLIFLSGLDSDTNLTSIVQGEPLTPSTATFNAGDFSGYSNKLVLELHVYDNILGTGPSDCEGLKKQLSNRGFETLTTGAANQLPLMVTEFGFPQDETTLQDPYTACIMDYFPQQSAGWMIWVISGSYYIREGTQDRDETWGLLSHDWSEWRLPEFVNDRLTTMVNATKAGLGKDPGDLPESPESGDGSSGGSTQDGDTAGSGATPQIGVNHLGLTLLLCSLLAVSEIPSLFKT